MFSDLSEPWQGAFMKAWVSFCRGSIPIGAVLTDETGKIISAGRNRLFEDCAANPKTAHAEMECLLKLNVESHPLLTQYTLYTTMEPCPMCMGTIVMSNIRKVRIASADSYCGAAYMCGTDPYMKSKNTDIEFAGVPLQDVQIAMQTYFELKRSKGKTGTIVQLYERDFPHAVRTARELLQESYLDVCAQNGVPFSEVYDGIVSRLSQSAPQE